MSTLTDESQSNLGWVYARPPYLPAIGDATTYLLSGPSGGATSVASLPFTVELNAGETLPFEVVVTPHASGGGSFTPSSVILTTISPSATFTYTPVSQGDKTISVTNDGGLTNPDSLIFTAVASTVATTYTLEGPSTGVINEDSTDFTVALPIGSTVPSPVTVTPDDGSDGSFTPSTVQLTTGMPEATFTYMPASLGDKLISVTNNGGLSNPPELIFGVSGTPGGGALVDGDPVTTWIDFSGNGNNLTAVGSARPTFKESIAGTNLLPVVRFTSAGLSKMILTAPISGAGPYTMYAVMKPAIAGSSDLHTLTSSADTEPLGLCELSADLCYFSIKTGGSYQTPNPHDGAFHIFEARIFDSTTAALDVDAVGQTLAHLSQSETHDFDTLGARGTVPAYSDGDISEILFFDSIIGGADGTNIRNYFLNKYYGTPDSFDPSTVAGLLGWWKADSLLDPAFTKIDTTVSGDAVRILVPLAPVSGAACIFCHGLGGSELNINDGSLNEVYTIPAVNAGYLVAACNAGGYQWDNATAQAKVENLIAYLVANYGITNVVMIGGSAGSPVGLLLATQGATGVTMKGWHGIYPVVDLDAAHSNAALTASIDAAFPTYPTDASGRDPILFAASDFDGLRLLCCQSASDTVTPKATHGDALVTLATGHATEVTCTATTGDHGDASNFTQALADDFVAFLGRCFP